MGNHTSRGGSGAYARRAANRTQTEQTIIGPRQHWADQNDMRAAVNQWAAKMSVKPTSISFADLPRKWGTMDTAGHLTLSQSLLSLPPRLGEYVMVHELAHRLAPNHGILFQAYLHAYMPDWQAREHELQQHGMIE